MKALFLRPEAVIYATLLVFTGIFFAFRVSLGNGNVVDFLRYTFGRGGDQILLVLLLFYVSLLVRVAVWWVKAAFRGASPLVYFSPSSLRVFLLSFRAFAKSVLFVGIPLTLCFLAFTAALGELNLLNKTRLQDELLFRWDVWLTGTFPPLAFAGATYPGWLIWIIDSSFLYLVSVFALFAAYLFHAKQRLFREAAAAFCVGSVLSFALWIAFPVMSPHDRFLDNVYGLPVPAAVRAYVQQYRPQPAIQEFLDSMRERKADLAVFPTSTFPSAHVFWGALLAYYAWRFKPWLLVPALLFVALSSLGTFLFAQHYFVDVPAGVAVAAVSIAVASWFASKHYGSIAQSPARA